MLLFCPQVQHLVTKMKRKKALLELTDPAAIRTELARHEARLDRVQQELVKARDARSPPKTLSPRTLSPPSGKGTEAAQKGSEIMRYWLFYHCDHLNHA